MTLRSIPTALGFAAFILGAAAFAQETPSEGGAAVRLHIETTAPRLELRQFEGWSSHFGRRPMPRSRLICVAPCDQLVAAKEEAQFFFSGPELPRSSLFQFDDRSGPLIARVQGGQRSEQSAGSMTAAFGGLGMGIGSLTLAFGFIAAGSSNPNLARDSREFKLAGAVLTSASVGALATGIVLFMRGMTRYSLSTPDN